MLSHKQIDIIKDQREWILASGSVRSGKTFAINIKELGFLESVAIPNVPVLWTGKTIHSVEQNIVDEFEKIANSFPGVGKNFEFQGKGAHVTGIYKPKKIKIICEGAYNDGAEERIRGLTVQHVLADEAPLQPARFFKQAIARCSAGPRAKFLTCNPDSPMHWFYKEFYTQIGKGLKYDNGKVWNFYLSKADNPSLKDDYIKMLKDMYHGDDYGRFVEGKWTGSSRLVFDQFGDKNVCVEYPNLNERERIIGIDWGYVEGHELVLLLCSVDKDGRFWIIDEYVKQKQLIDLQLLNTLRNKGWFREGDLTTCYCDSARPDLIQQWQNLVRSTRATVVGVAKGPGSVDAGITEVQHQLATESLHILDTCVNTINSMMSYQRKEDKDGNILPDIIKKNDNEADALRYLVHGYQPRENLKKWAELDGTCTDE